MIAIRQKATIGQMLNCQNNWKFLPIESIQLTEWRYQRTNDIMQSDSESQSVPHQVFDYNDNDLTFKPAASGLFFYLLSGFSAEHHT